MKKLLLISVLLLATAVFPQETKWVSKSDILVLPPNAGIGTYIKIKPEGLAQIQIVGNNKYEVKIFRSTSKGRSLPKRTYRPHTYRPRTYRLHTYNTSLLRIGMSVGIVRRNFGRPTSINKSVNAYGIREQWVYKNRKTIYLYFKDNILTSWQE